MPLFSSRNLCLLPFIWSLSLSLLPPLPSHFLTLPVCRGFTSKPVIGFKLLSRRYFSPALCRKTKIISINILWGRMGLHGNVSLAYIRINQTRARLHLTATPSGWRCVTPWSRTASPTLARLCGCRKLVKVVGAAVRVTGAQKDLKPLCRVSSHRLHPRQEVFSPWFDSLHFAQACQLFTATFSQSYV